MSVVRSHRLGLDAGAEDVAHRAHVRVGLDRLTCALQPIVRSRSLLLRRRIDIGRRERDLETHGLAEVRSQRLREPLLERRPPELLAVGIENQLNPVALTAGERAVVNRSESAPQ